MNDKRVSYQEISSGLGALCPEPRTNNKYIYYHNTVFIIIYIGPLDTCRIFLSGMGNKSWQ